MVAGLKSCSALVLLLLLFTNSVYAPFISSLSYERLNEDADLVLVAYFDRETKTDKID